MTGFLSKAAHGEGAAGGLALLPGSLVEVVVTQASDRRMIAVTTDSPAVSANLTREWDGLSIGKIHGPTLAILPWSLLPNLACFSQSCEHGAAVSAFDHECRFLVADH